MLFTSLHFVILVLITFACYYFPPFRKAQLLILILASFVFYAYARPWLLLLLVFSCTANAVSSYLVFRSRGLGAMRLWAALGIAANLSLLLFFKYGKLLYATVGGHAERGDGVGRFLLAIPLPIGISFFTFQGISLVVDVFRWKKNGEPAPFLSDNFFRHWYHTTFFKSFFPQLIAGPIVKARQFLPQIASKYIGGIRWQDAFGNLVTGYFFKMVVADNLNDLTYRIYAPFFQNVDSANLLLMLFGYSMQIFADFAGYSLIALGLGELFGYRLPMNFNFPYVSESFSEFWTRWHISLSTWLAEYLYIPLGGNRKGKARTYANLFIVMFLGGLWHGAAWSYAIWGSFHGLLLALERFFFPKAKARTSGHGLIALARMASVFAAVTFAWLLFKLPRIGDAFFYLKCIALNTHLHFVKYTAVALVLYSLPVILYHLHHLYNRRRENPSTGTGSMLVYAVMLFLLAVNSGIAGEFIYFQF